MQVDNKIQCAICGKSYHIISPTHLKKSHDLTIAEYRKLYPNAPISSPKQRATLIKGNKSRINEENKVEIECEWCEKKILVSKKAHRKFCSQRCFYDSKKGIAPLNSVKKKISEKARAHVNKQKHPWEQIITENNGIPKWLIEIYELLSKKHENISLNHKIPSGHVVDIALLEEKIGITFLKGWNGYPTVNPQDSETHGWYCCDVFSQVPSKAVHILKNHLSKVGKCPSIKTADFRYTSHFYEQYKNSMTNSTVIF